MRFQLNPDFPEATREQKWDQFRLYRLTQMQMSDWTQGNDVTLSADDVEKYRAYRALLKNAPNVYENVENIEFPGYVAVIDYNMVFVDAPYKV